MGPRSEVHEAWADFLKGFRMGTYLTLTWSDQAAVADGLGYRDRYHSVYGHPNSGDRALAVARGFLEENGYGLRYFLAAEYGAGGRDVPHVHGIMAGVSKRRREELWYLWKSRRGMARILPVTDGCESYITKYLMKSGSDHLIDFRLAIDGDGHLTRCDTTPDHVVHKRTLDRARSEQLHLS